MTDSNVADTYGGGSHRRARSAESKAADGADPGVIADSEKVVEQLSSVLGRHVGSINKDKPDGQPNLSRAGQQMQRSPLKAIAQQIKQLVHDDGEQFGDELKAIAATKRESVEISMAKALQIWADETMKDKPASETNNK